MAPVPRRELPGVVGFEIDGEEAAADAAAPVARREPLVDEGFEIEEVEEAADAVDAPDVSKDAKIDVWVTADGEGVGAAISPWLHVTGFDCGELSTLKVRLRNIWGLPSEAW